jgi:hypothetical protein
LWELQYQRSFKEVLMIWTGYFARHKIYQLAHMQLISIANTSMFGVKALEAKWLAPGGWVYAWKDRVKRIDDNKEKELIEYYIERYTKEILGVYSPEEVWSRLHSLAGCRDAVILCYEAIPKAYGERGYSNGGIVTLDGLAPGVSFCHRHIVSGFMRSGGFECREYIPSSSELTILKRKNHDDEFKEGIFA